MNTPLSFSCRREMAAYFQDATDVLASMETLGECDIEGLELFIQLLADAAKMNRGIYVTF